LTWIRFLDSNIFVLDFMNIFLWFAFRFCNFGERYVSNMGWPCLIHVFKMVDYVRRRGGCPTRCSRLRCVFVSEAGKRVISPCSSFIVCTFTPVLYHFKWRVKSLILQSLMLLCTFTLSSWLCFISNSIKIKLI